MLLRITDGTTTVTYSANTGSPTFGLAGAIYIPTESDEPTATETAEIVFNGPSASIVSAMTTTRRLLAQAAERLVNPGIGPVYVEYSIADGLPAWRSLLHGGRVVWPTERNDRQLQNTYATGTLGLVFTRLNYWEGPQEALLESAGINNGTLGNAVNLTAPSGDQPAPITVEIVNQNADNDARNFYLNLDSFAGLPTSNHLLTTGAGAKSWAGAVNYNFLQWVLPIPDAVTAKLTGYDVNIIGAFSSLSAGIYLRATLYSLVDGSLYVPLSNGGEKYASDRKLHNLGTLQFPKLINGNLVVAISVYATVAGSGSLTFAQLAPARNAVHLEATGEWTSNDAVLYDGANDTAWYDSGSGRYPSVSAHGGPLMAWPGRTNRLFVLYDEFNAFNPSRSLALSVWARPRRKTL